MKRLSDAPDFTRGEDLALREQEQLALAAGYLRLMNADVELDAAPDAVRIRDAFRASRGSAARSR